MQETEDDSPPEGDDPLAQDLLDSPAASLRAGMVDISIHGEIRIRQFDNGLIESPDDPLVMPDLAGAELLRPSSWAEVETEDRQSRRRRSGGGRNSRVVVSRIVSIEGMVPQEYSQRKEFSQLTAIDPQPRMQLEHRGCPAACRLIDMFCPIGYGTRGLIVAPPKAGKTILLQNIAHGVKFNHPDVEVIALLIDERPEEVTDFRRNVPAEVLASNNDQDVDQHCALGILAIERAKRMLEAGRNVLVLLDSLTRLGRAFNNSRKYATSGRTMSGGLDARALDIPKQLFGAARRAEEGGSLTIIASCLVDTGSRADQIIFEEFKGTGNMELILDRNISDKRVFPAINLAASGTRKEHLLLGERELKTVTALRRRLMSMPPAVQVEQLLTALKRYDTNDALVGT
ncbi:MAG: transcription termination factor Rho [Phycisphaerales bacterium]|nr:transcription termination factor Rho [Phycisphaerales bacterium]